MSWSLRSTLGFLAFGLVVLAALNIAGRLPVSGPTEPQIMRERYAEVIGVDAVSLGGSTGTAIDFDAMCVNGARFWNNGQDLFEAEALIDFILAGRDPPNTFFLVLTPGAVAHDNGLPVQTGTYRRRFTYRFLQAEGHWGLIGGDWRQAFLAQAMPAIGSELRFPWLSWALRALNKVPPLSTEEPPDTASVVPAAADALAAAQMAQWESLREDTRYRDPAIERRTRAALIRMARRIRAADARLVIVIPPYIRPLADRMAQSDTAILSDFEQALVAAEAEGAVVERHFDDPAMQVDYGNFRDAVHLNAPGARRFSRRLALDLAQRGLLDNARCTSSPSDFATIE